MTDIVEAWTDQGWCDACKTNIAIKPHEPGCPIAEIERLKDVLEEIRRYSSSSYIRDMCWAAIEGRFEDLPTCPWSFRSQESD